MLCIAELVATFRIADGLGAIKPLPSLKGLGTKRRITPALTCGLSRPSLRASAVSWQQPEGMPPGMLLQNDVAIYWKAHFSLPEIIFIRTNLRSAPYYNKKPPKTDLLAECICPIPHSFLEERL